MKWLFKLNPREERRSFQIRILLSVCECFVVTNCNCGFVFVLEEFDFKKDEDPTEKDFFSLTKPKLIGEYISLNALLFCGINIEEICVILIGANRFDRKLRVGNIF